MGYNYEIIYKKGVVNIVENALSRVSSTKLITLTLSAISTELMDRVRGCWKSGFECRKLI